MHSIVSADVLVLISSGHLQDYQNRLSEEEAASLLLKNVRFKK